MANEENLIPFSQLSREEARKIQSAGGKARVAQIRKRKTLREAFLALLEDERTQNKVTEALLNKVLEGDVSAYKALEATIGEKPVDRTELTGKDGADLTPIQIVMPKDDQ